MQKHFPGVFGGRMNPGLTEPSFIEDTFITTLDKHSDFYYYYYILSFVMPLCFCTILMLVLWHLSQALPVSEAMNFQY